MKSNLDIRVIIAKGNNHSEITYSQEIINSRYTIGIQADAVSNAISALIKNTIIDLFSELFQEDEIIDW